MAIFQNKVCIVSILVAVLMLLTAPAGAHSLRAFARVTDGQIGGYAFFVGGGRPAGVEWVATMNGKRIAQGKTGPDGSYRFPVPSPVVGDVLITVDTREGHIATTRLNAARLQTGPASSGTTAPSGSDKVTQNFSPSSASSGPQSRSTDTESQAGSDTVDIQHVEQALERQIGPLLERIEAMDARMRLSDILSGIFLIIGLAGIGLWARQRRR